MIFFHGHIIIVMCRTTASKYSHYYVFLHRGRGGAVPPPPPGRGAVVPRGTVGTRSSLPTAMLTRGVSVPRARGTAGTPGYRAPLLQATHKTYDDYVSKTNIPPWTYASSFFNGFNAPTTPSDGHLLCLSPPFSKNCTNKCVLFLLHQYNLPIQFSQNISLLVAINRHYLNRFSFYIKNTACLYL